jgi:hypothetical protein
VCKSSIEKHAGQAFFFKICMVFDLLEQMMKMNRFFLLIILSFSTMSYAQEFNSSAVREIPEFQQLEFLSSEEIFIGTRKAARPSLSLLAPEFPESQLSLTEVNFNKEKKREVNIIAMMEQERYERESSYIELESPMPNLSKGEKTLIEVTNDIRIHDRSSNFDIYTGEKKIPAYQEMRVPLFSSPYHSRSRVRGYVSPYYY